MSMLSLTELKKRRETAYEDHDVEGVGRFRFAVWSAFEGTIFDDFVLMFSGDTERNARSVSHFNGFVVCLTLLNPDGSRMFFQDDDVPSDSRKAVEYIEQRCREVFKHLSRDEVSAVSDKAERVNGIHDDSKKKSDSIATSNSGTE